MGVRSLKLSRRDFMKASVATVAVAAGLAKYGRDGLFKKVEAQHIQEQAEQEGVRLVKTICTGCAVGCGILGKVKDDVFIGIEPWVNHPINRGKLCCKGATVNHIVTSPKRLRYPMIKRNGKWERISWEEALDIIARKMIEIRQKYGPDAIFFAGSAKVSTEVAYLMRKFMAFWGSNNIDHQARICHSTTVAGLGNTWGYGAMTNNFNDMRNARCIIFFSNPAEAHPVSFYHIYEAKRRGAVLICCDPRFSRTAAVSDLHLQFRPGTDIALVWGICYEIIKNGWYDEEFIKNRTYGFEKAKEIIMQYPPELVEDITGVPAEKIRKAAYILATHRPATLQYAMGGTQHEYGAQNIRAYAILQLLLGNAGKPGGGVNAFRGHDNVQGATDMCVLSHSLPAYYGLSEKAWKHWCNVWKVDYEWIKSRFASEEMMHKKGFTMARFAVGAVAGTDAYPGTRNMKIDQPAPLKMIFIWGHSTPSLGDLKLVKKAFETVELLVFVDPFVESGAAMADRDDGIILLPAATEFEGEGFVTNSGRQIQWRNRVVEPLYESKEDMWILLSLVKALDRYEAGLYEKFTINFGNKSPEEIRPEDVWDNEVTVGCRSIGMIGQKSWRIKRQQEYDYTFDPETCRAVGGPCDGEYWGLPWPCWNEKHPGTPILYRNDIPVWEGGHDFRVKWGTTAPDGASLLSGVNGHDQIPGWATNLETDYSEWLDKNMVPSGRGRARFYAWNMKDPVPVHREPIFSPRLDLVDKYPVYDDSVYGEYHYRVQIRARSYQVAWKNARLKEVFPLIWTSGRQVEHMGGGAETRANRILAELQPDMYVEINPKDANERGIKNGEMVAVISPRGLEYGDEPAYVVVKAKVTHAVPPGVVFMPFHWGGYFQGQSYLDRFPVTKDMDTRPFVAGDSANIINPPGWDPETQMQATKAGICEVVKLTRLEEFRRKNEGKIEALKVTLMRR
ncbi:formate dehydrogenase subunit alpha [Archaeoglobus veneficus]|uniref:Nitrate reductase n=1 Tax=Archaeoglobus veneficus (strain DSM 11195 / SNP6) TaxID=693661 RepID=F2KRH5_ARCVS|nr:formate dehydrogenase subunit alpha [Archaeoglobus veneficus]AEA46740.1 Nitrate reductase [Archaeoglobus veneficus SNP6]